MSYTKISTQEILQWLKNNLTEERYEHSLGTADCAKELAIKFGLDSEKAYVAGLLHDCAKCFSNEKMLNIIENNLTIEEEEKTNFKTLHAPVSAYVAKKEFGVEDEEILSAIRWHTIGKLEMSVFEKIIFLADKIENRTREKEFAQPIKDCMVGEKALDLGLLQCYKQTIKSLVERDLKICSLTVDIYNKLEDVK
jgi:predicted HD superfamily hydrolase involved in NAD metabolism